jgi:A/G-specific adenine glycosylase
MNVEEEITNWYHKYKRDLAWRKTKDPYIIWISVIMLQQTRVEQASGYFERFTKRFPDIKTLAEASEEEVLNYWQGLGYYSRARNLHFSAKFIENELNGKFPTDYNSIIKLKGVGEYTAAAIASFAFNEKVPAIDGNVYRVLARLFNEHSDTVSADGKKVFRQIAENLIKNQNAANYNQAMMEFGALLCKPSNPLCAECPVNDVCLALKQGTIKDLPTKKKALKLKKRYFHYIFILSNKNTLIKKRINKDIWQGLFEFPMIETRKAINTEQLISSEQWKKLIGKEFQLLEVSTLVQHRLSHQLLHISFYTVKTDKLKENILYKPVPIKELVDYPVPKVMENFINSDSFANLTIKYGY